MTAILKRPQYYIGITGWIDSDYLDRRWIEKEKFVVILPIHFVYSNRGSYLINMGLSGYMLIFVNSTTIPTPLPLPRIDNHSSQREVNAHVPPTN